VKIARLNVEKIQKCEMLNSRQSNEEKEKKMPHAGFEPTLYNAISYF
jgi:hypothetical protein